MTVILNFWISFSLQSVICGVCVCTENVWGGSQLLIKHHSQGHLKIPFTFFIELNKSDHHNCFHFIHFHLIYIHLYQLLSSIDVHFQAKLTCFCPMSTLTNCFPFIFLPFHRRHQFSLIFGAKSRKWTKSIKQRLFFVESWNFSSVDRSEIWCWCMLLVISLLLCLYWQKHHCYTQLPPSVMSPEWKQVH